MNPNATLRWWRTGISSWPVAVRAVLHVFGGAVMVFAVWARLQALYLSERVLIVFVLLMVAGFVLVLIARGVLRATGLMLLLLSVPELMHYYAYGLGSNDVGIVLSVVCFVAGIVCLLRASSQDSTISVLKQAN